MGWIIFFIIIGVLVISGLNSMNEDEKSVESYKIRHGVTHYNDSLIYVGGFPNIKYEDDMQAQIMLNEDEIHITIMKKFDVNRYYRTMKFHDIQDIKLVSKEEIREKISLGNCILFGKVGLLMKEKSTKIQNLLLISYYDDNIGNTIEVLFSGDNLYEITTKLRRLVLKVASAK